MLCKGVAQDSTNATSIGSAASRCPDGFRKVDKPKSRVLCSQLSPTRNTSKKFKALISMPTITKGDKVLVTGANGYIAMWTVRIFLERGYSVRGAVRSEDKARFIRNYFQSLGFGDKIETVIVEDITKVGLIVVLSWK